MHQRLNFSSLNSLNFTFIFSKLPNQFLTVQLYSSTQHFVLNILYHTFWDVTSFRYIYLIKLTNLFIHQRITFLTLQSNFNRTTLCSILGKFPPFRNQSVKL